MRASLLLAPLLGALATGCIVEPKVPDGAPGEKGRASGAASAMGQVKTGAILEDKIELVGATFRPSAVTPGETTKVTLVFRALDPITDDFQIFVHVEDPASRQQVANLDHAPAQGKRPTSGWKKGDYIEDEFVLALAPGVSARAVNLWVGLWNPRTNARLELRNPDKVSNDGTGRILLAQLKVTP